jgi:hypothetical protein
MTTATTTNASCASVLERRMDPHESFVEDRAIGVDMIE